MKAKSAPQRARSPHPHGLATRPRRAATRLRRFCRLAPVALLLGMILSACLPSALDVTIRPIFEGNIRVVAVPSYQTSTVVVTADRGRTFHIPPGHLPPRGKCRIWNPDLPPGHQSKPGSCKELARRVPPGSFLVRR